MLSPGARSNRRAPRHDRRACRSAQRARLRFGRCPAFVSVYVVRLFPVSPGACRWQAVSSAQPLKMNSKAELGAASARAAGQMERLETAWRPGPRHPHERDVLDPGVLEDPHRGEMAIPPSITTVRPFAVARSGSSLRRANATVEPSRSFESVDRGDRS